MSTAQRSHDEDNGAAFLCKQRPGWLADKATGRAFSVLLALFLCGGCCTGRVRFELGKRVPPKPYGATKMNASSLVGTVRFLPFLVVHGEWKPLGARFPRTIGFLIELPIAVTTDTLMFHRDFTRRRAYETDMVFWEQFLAEADEPLSRGADAGQHWSRYVDHYLYRQELAQIPFSESKLNELIRHRIRLRDLAANRALSHEHARHIFELASSAEGGRWPNTQNRLSTRLAIALNPSTSPELLTELAESGDKLLAWHVAANPSLPLSSIEKLCAGMNDNTNLANALARNPSSPRPVLEQAMTRCVPLDLLLNPALPVDMANSLFADPRLCSRLVDKWEAPERNLMLLVAFLQASSREDRGYTVRRCAQHRNAGPELIRTAWRTGFLEPRLVTGLDATPSDVLHEIAESLDLAAAEYNWFLAYRLARHTNTTPEACAMARRKMVDGLAELTTRANQLKATAPAEYEERRYVREAVIGCYESVIRDLDTRLSAAGDARGQEQSAGE